MLAHLICCIDHSDVIPFVVSILRVLAEHVCVRNKVLGNVWVWLHVGGMGYIAQPLSVRMAGILAVAVRFSRMMSCVGWITGFIFLSQFLQHVYQTVLRSPQKHYRTCPSI